MSTLFRVIRIPVMHHRDAGRYSPHINECVGPMVTVQLDYIDSQGVTHAHRYRVVLRLEKGQWCNVTLARSGQSIGRLKSYDFIHAGVTPGDKSRPRQVAQHFINRVAHQHGRQAVARVLDYAEQAGPVANPEILSAGHTTSQGIAPA